MSKFQIEFKKSVEKDLKKIDSCFLDAIFFKIEKLENYPDISGMKKLSTLKDFYRVRVLDYRIIFQVSKLDKKIIIYYVRHRRFVYKWI